MKKFISIFMSALMLCGVLSTTAGAVASTDTTDDIEATVLTQEEIDQMPDAVLVGTQTLNFLIDENGDLIDVVEGDLSSVPSTYSSSAPWNGQYHRGTVRLYKSGSSYYVSLYVKASTDWWVTKVELKNRAAGTSKWAELSKTFNNNPNSVVVNSKVYYPSTPCDVQVKGYIAVRSDGVLEKAYNWYSNIKTLTKP